MIQIRGRTYPLRGISLFFNFFYEIPYTMQFHSKTPSEKFPCSLLFSGKWIPINRSTYRWNPVDILINTWVHQTATIKKWWTGVLRPSNANSRMKIRSLPFCLHLFCGKENSFPRQNILTDSWFFCSGKERRFISKIWLFEVLQIISSGIFTNIYHVIEL